MRGVSRTELMRGVMLTCVRDMRFKTGVVSVTFLAPLSSKTASQNAALPWVLRRGSSMHPGRESLSAALDELYGARIEPVVRKAGEVQCVGLSADFPDGAFVPAGGRILEKTASLLGEILLSPATSGGRLRADYVESERSNLVDDIRAGINDKSAFALRRAVETMFRGEAYSVDCLGTLASAERIGVAPLTRRYRELLASSPVEVFYCGAEEPGLVEDLMRETLAALPREREFSVPATKLRFDVPEEPKVVVERRGVSQGRLVMGWRVARQDQPAAMVLNAVFGGTANSRLFTVVREKLGLCYSADTFLDRYKSFLAATCGIDKGSFDAVRSEIERQLDDIRSGGLTERELEAGKKSVMSAIYAATDEPGGLEELYLDRALLGLEAEPEELAALVADVKADEVAETARSAKLDTVYFLTGEGEDAEA